MRKVERKVHSLKPSNIASIRQWFVDFDDDDWDTKLTANIAASQQDATAEALLDDHTASKAKPR